MAVLVDKQTKVICQGLTGSPGVSRFEWAIAADDLKDGAQKIVKAVKG